MNRTVIAAAIIGGCTVAAVGVVLGGIWLARPQQPGQRPNVLPGPMPWIFAPKLEEDPDREEERILERIASSSLWKRPVTVVEARGWLEQARTMKFGERLVITPECKVVLHDQQAVARIRPWEEVYGRDPKCVRIDFGHYQSAPSRRALLRELLAEVERAEFQR